jgi:type II secretory pathway predicted ATPase ExeA
MYKNFFGLREAAFNMNPDPRFLFATRHSEEVLACLTYGIQNLKGFMLLTGEVGTGKTTLLNKLLEWLRPAHVATAFVFNSRLDPMQFLDFMMADFGISCESSEKSRILLRLNQWLLERYRAGQTAVLIVDEAQNLSPQALEEIRLLTNLETSSEKLLQIVLSGQPELDEKLKQPKLRQLRQRIALRCKTYPLTLEETFGYIAERIRIAGGNNQPIFSSEAVETIYRYAQGIPRVINLLCEHALISAYVDEQKPVLVSTIEPVAREFELHEIEPIAKTSTTIEGGENLRLMEAVQNLAILMDRLRRSD